MTIRLDRGRFSRQKSGLFRDLRGIGTANGADRITMTCGLRQWLWNYFLAGFTRIYPDLPGMGDVLRAQAEEVDKSRKESFFLDLG
jgi:hypothetical protein